MNEPSADFDLKLMPDWLKEAPAKNPYANYEVRESDRLPFGEKRGRGGDSQRPRGRGQGGGLGGGLGRGGDGPRVKRDEGKRDQIRGEQRPGFRSGPRENREGPRPHHAPSQPPPVRVEFLPDPACVSSIAKQIRATNRAYSLFDLARMFLAKPERHRVRITTNDKNAPLFQAGENGPVSLERGSLERAAFSALRSQFYAEEKIQRDPPKGNFSNVARHRLTGTLLGPTNYHGYQLALRKLYEERFSRRMSFPDFQREIQTVSDPGLIEQWKEQVRTSTVYRVIPEGGATPPAAAAPEATEEKKEGAISPEVAAELPQPQQTEEAPLSENPPAVSETEIPSPAETMPDAAAPEPAAEAPQTPVFETLAEMEQHFRKHHLESVLRSAQSFIVPGEASRSVPDRRIATAVREGWENETGFPGQVMHHLRVGFTQAGLHVWKHRKRMQFVSAVRPAPFTGKSEHPFSPTVAEILRLVETTPGCTRAKLGAAMLGSVAETDPELPKRKAALATDLRWLIDTGRVIEFYDGKLELPLSPKEESAPAATPKPASIQPAAEIPRQTTADAPLAESSAAAAEEPTATSPEPPSAES